MNKNAKIYIAGHNGLVGSAVLRRFQEQGYNNIIVRRRSELDLLDAFAVNKFFSDEKPDHVILVAAKVGGVLINKEFPFEMLYENIQIQNHVIGSAFFHNVQSLLFVASSTIYPSECQQPISESILLTGALDSLHESYGLAKISGLKLCEKIRQQAGRDFFTLVPTNIYGIGDHFEEHSAHVIGALMTRFHNAKIQGIPEVMVWGTGDALREFLYVDDLAVAIQFFSENMPPSSHINIGTHQEVCIRDLSYTIAQVVGYNGDIVFDSTKPEGRLRRKLDTSLATSFGWNASVSLEEGLAKTYQYFTSTL